MEDQSFIIGLVTGIVIGIAVTGIPFVILMQLKNGGEKPGDRITTFTRDEKGRIIEVMEKPLNG